MNIESVIAEKRLATEDIDDPALLLRLTWEATRDADKAEDAALELKSQQMRQGR